jgi:CspA family cold shock protein
MSSRRLTGTVTTFDVDRGLGDVTASDGEVLPFHCVAIADGTRDIATGTPVSFAILLKLGRREATDIRPVGAVDG